nr:hypothetical protein [Acidobacteriota bacterium]
GENHAVLDGNVARVVARLEAVRGDLREVTRWTAVQESADRLLAHDKPGDWNQAMMELGAMICTPRSPECLLCPVAKFCQARALGIQELIPEKRKKRATVEVRLAAAVIVNKKNGCLLLPPPGRAKKKATAHDIPTLVSRMWHFPTVAVGDDPANALRKYLSMDLLRGMKLPLRLVALRKIRHSVTYRAITLSPFRVECDALPGIAGAKNVLLEDFASVPVSNLTRKIARAALASS